MKQKLLFVSILFLFFIEFSQAQNASNTYLVRATTGLDEYSENRVLNNKQFINKYLKVRSNFILL